MPQSQRFNGSDLVLSIDSLSRPYAFCQVMAALYANASVALTSVAAEDADFALATAAGNDGVVSPTVIVASSRTMGAYHRDLAVQAHAGPAARLARWLQTRSLDAGRMPTATSSWCASALSPRSRLRLLCISHRVDADPAVRLTTQQLTDLRLCTGARVVYALTGPGVAGAVTQTHVFDYRRLDGGVSHFGAPLSSVEVLLTAAHGDDSLDVHDDKLEGQVSRARNPWLP